MSFSKTPRTGQIPDELAHSANRTRTRFHYAIAIILLLGGLTLRLLHNGFHKESQLWEVIGDFGTFLALTLSIHFVYDLFIRREERQAILFDFGKILGTELQDIRDALHLSRARCYPKREDAYSAAVEAIRRVDRTQGERTILLTALHGDSGKRRTVLPSRSSSRETFDSLLADCMSSSGPDMWYVRELYNVIDRDRLEMIERRMERAGEAEGYEVRAFCLQNAIPQLAPLVIGGYQLFIGIDDPTFYGVRGALRIDGEPFVQFATEYFESLWGDGRAYRLRTGTGINRDELERLRKAMMPSVTNDAATTEKAPLAGKDSGLETGGPVKRPHFDLID